MQVVLENEALKVTINSFGAELASIRGKATDTEYLWNADAKFWKRTAPVLFPFVGSLKNKEYHYEGKTYSMGQHGFARDMEFAVDVQTATEAWFSLQSNEETKAKFPLEFILKIGYELEGKELKVIWQVENPDTKTLYFSIGGHPAFMCPVDEKGKQSEYYFKFDTDKDLTYGLVADDGQGLMGQQKDVLPVKNGYAQITEHLFDRDALIVENRQKKGLYGIKNVSQGVWRGFYPDGKIKDIPNGQGIPIWNGMSVRFELGEEWNLRLMQQVEERKEDEDEQTV